MPRHELVNAVRAAGLGTTVLDAAMSSHLTRTPAGATSAGGVGSLTTCRATWRTRPTPWRLTIVADGAPRTVCPDGAGVSHMPRLGAGRATQSEGVKPAGRLIDFFSRNSSSPSGPNSRPMPDSLKPPKGVEKSMGIGLFSM